MAEAQTRSYLGHVLNDAGGQRIGKIDNVYFSADGDWVSVVHGKVHAHTSYIPVSGARLAHAGLSVPYTADDVKAAPEIHNAAGTLAAAELVALKRYFDEHETPVVGDSTEPGTLERPFTGSSTEGTFGTGTPGVGEPDDVTAQGT